MADPTTWTPKFEEKQIRELIGEYQVNPSQFNDRDDDIDVLEEHANHYRIPFARNSDHQDGFIAKTIKAAGRGWFEGFTTLPPEKIDDFTGTSLGRDPEDTTEAIARNLGHLAGFVGYLPGAKALRALGAVKLAGGLASLKGKSVPMAVANKAQKAVGKVASPYLRDLPSFATEGILADMSQGAFHLGIASAASSWTHGVNEMFGAAGFGAVAGGAFRGIGNMSGFGKKLEAGQLKPNGSPDISKLAPGQKADLAARTMAGAAFQGLPSSLQGATTEEQVYAYAMGAFFGYKEMPYQTRTSREFLAETFKKDTGADPEMNPRWDTLTREMQSIVRRDFEQTFGGEDVKYAVYDIMKGKGIKAEDIERMAEEFGGVKQEVDPTTGEMVNSKISKQQAKEYKEAYKDDPRFAEQQDLDMHIEAMAEIPMTIAGKGAYVDRLFDNRTNLKVKSGSERLDFSDKLFKKWKSFWNETTGKPKQDAEQKIVEFIEKETGTKLSTEEESWWRNYGERFRKEELIEQIEMVNGEVGILKGVTNSVGNKKTLKQERMIIEDVYEAEHLKHTGEPIKQNFFRVLDHMIWGGKETDLSRAEMILAKQELLKIKGKEDYAEYTYSEKIKESQRIAKEKVQKAYAELHNKMWSENVDIPYYYYGGKGDAKKMYFVKLHPSIHKNAKQVKRYRRALLDVMRQQKDRNGKLIKGNLKEYRDGRKAFIKKYPGIKNASSRYDQMYMSNVLYELSNNGYALEKPMGSKESFAEFKGKMGMLLKRTKYINDPKAFNKRAQIWFNSGLSANPSEIFRQMRKVLGNDNDFMGLNFRVGFFGESKGGDMKVSDLAQKYAEISDGAILAREEVVDALNIDKGLPTSGKVNKSFIVSPNPALGTLLGKYMIHTATPELSKYMKDNKIHMMIPESAAKQMGERELGKLTLENEQIKFRGNIYDVPANHFRTVMSEITAEKYLKKQGLPKQMYSVMSAYGYKDVDPKVMRDMYDSLSERAISGTPEGNERIEKYLGDKSESNIKDLVNNIEDLPVHRVFDLIRDPSNGKLSQKLYEKILKINNEFVESLGEEGEMTRQEVQQHRENAVEFESVVDRLTRVFPDGSINAYMHKFSRDYRMQSMRNYVVQKLTRPKIDNSVVSRMRPWEIGMQMKNKETLRLNKEDNIFFLDEGFRQLIIKDSLIDPKRNKLGEVWEDYKSGRYDSNKEGVESVLEAIGMRVPMDSISGAHSLKFAGFTGVKGFGSLLHPRSMKALGGADLDGDKAFFFFGGEDSGFKKSWRKMYNDAKDEYVDPLTGKEKHNKDAIDPETGKSYGETLALRDPKLTAKFSHQTAQYSPYWRGFMSEGASGGRDNLGTAVTGRSAIIGAYNAIRGQSKDKKWVMDEIVMTGRDNIEHLTKDGKRIKANVELGGGKYSVPYMDNQGRMKRIEFTAKTGEKDLQRFREMSRAAIALGSDPMDEAGIKGELFGTKMLDTLFNYKVFSIDAKGNKKFDNYMTKRVEAGKANWLKSHGLQSKFLELNRLLYGKNHKDNRRWSYAEIQSGIEKFSYLPESAKNTFLPQVAESMKGVNWSDNLFRRINTGALDKIYAEHVQTIKEFDWLKEVMGRDTLASQKGRFISEIMERGLFRDEAIKRLASDETAWIEFVDGTYNLKGVEKPITGGIPRDFLPRRVGDYNYRRAYLEHLVLKAEDFLVNDLSDIASMKSTTDVINKYNLSPEDIRGIHTEVDVIKSLSFQYAKKRKSLDDILQTEYSDKELVKLNEEARKAFGLSDKGDAKVDQQTIDAMIRQYKKSIENVKGGEELFDMLYMGTYTRGDRQRSRVLEKMREKPQMRQQIFEIEKFMKNTTLTRSGIQSQAVKDANLKKFFKNYDELITKAGDDLTTKEFNELNSELNKKKDIDSYFDLNGKKVKGEFVDVEKLSESDKIYLDDIAPFEGLSGGNIKDPELRQVKYNLKEHLDHYHNLDARNLNGLFRGIFKKNINEATKYDLQTLDRYLQEMRNGTWFRKTMDWMLGKDKNPTIKRAYYWMFPKAVNRDLMREPAMMEWVEDVGPYKDRLGNTLENARTIRPTSVIGEIQQLSARTQELSMQKSEETIKEFQDSLRPIITALEDGDMLFKIAVAKRELGMIPKVEKANKLNGHKAEFGKYDYKKNWNDVRKVYNELKNKTYIVPTKEGRVKMTGEKAVDYINQTLTNWNMKTRKWMTGDQKAVNKWLKMAETNGEVSWKGLDALRKNFHNYINDTVRRNKTIPIEELGIDGMRSVIKRIVASHTPLSLRTKENLNKIRRDIKITKYDETGDLGAETYYPHMSFDRKSSQKRLERALKSLKDDPNLSKKEKQADMKKLFHTYKNLTGDFLSKDQMGDNFDAMQEVMVNAAMGRKTKAQSILTNDLKKVGNQFSRDSHIGGWDMTPEAYEAYMKNTINTFYKQAMQVSARTSMHNFNKSFFRQTGDAGLTRAWGNFFKLYTQSAMGYPTHIPQKVMDNPAMKIKGTPYKWLADSTAKKRIDYIRKRLGIGRKELEKMNLDTATVDELSGIEYTQLQSWGSMEAKWQLASLLAHPKSAIANLYGGTVHTWISTGYSNLKKARDFEYLRTNINPEWKSMKDVERWMQELGIIEEFLVYEAGLNPQLKSQRMQNFTKDVVSKLKRDPNLSDESMWQIGKKHKLTRPIFDAASSFMRIPERTLRRDSFMAHYIQAKNKFGGAISDFNSPFLINMAKRGVKGTQFLYSAPFRPLWTNSTLGRVFSRFQLWSWNSVRFRNDVLKRASIAGYQEGTQEMETFKRLAMADAFMIGMSNLFMYSLFENALPAPYNWMQDTADLLMGDEKERERAFYGSPIGPLQAVTPPALRLLPPIFKGMMSDDYSQLTDYYLWTMAPFGRLIRDVVGPGGVVENPYYAVTKMTGLPVLQAGSKVKEEKTPRIGQKLVY